MEDLTTQIVHGGLWLWRSAQDFGDAGALLRQPATESHQL